VNRGGPVQVLTRRLMVGFAGVPVCAKSENFMRLLKYARLRSALWAAVLVFPLLAHGGFTPSGSEEAKPGNLRGDQTLPQAAIDHTGGFLVWQDNNVDNSGLGIKAQRLDSSLNKLGTAFRVNLQTAGDQEKPQVSLLRDGGAVFVWQGGRQGAQRVYARFLTANGTFASGDTRVNTYTNGPQLDPAVATLADGSVVVVWSSVGQDGSMQGVYAQRFSPKGARMGGEFQVNQTTLYNQRSPVVASLTNGNYVVAWVSELQRNSVSVDIYARVFDAAGAAVGGEFPVNSSLSNTCANPSISASLLTGSFAIAWSQDDNQRLAIGNAGDGAIVTNAPPHSTKSWDVLARFFGPAGNALTGEFTVNSTTYGDQFGPVVRAFGEQYGVLWTSLGQDGSREGVYGQFLESDGTLSGTEFRVNNTTVSRQIQPALASDNHSQLLAVWSSFHGNGTGFDLFGQKFSSSQVIPLERLASSVPAIEEPSTGLPRLEFPTEPGFNDPAPNAFAMAAGNYSGLFFDKYGVNSASSGYLLVKTTAKGAYSGKLLLGGSKYSFKGTFDESGWAAGVISRKNAMPLNIYLQMDLGGGDSLRGSVSDGDWWADLQADRQVFQKASNPAPKAGNYTMLIRGGGSGPDGDGVATVSVNAKGAISLKGTLADGTKMTQKSAVSKTGYWPLYVSLYRGGGVLLGWLEFDNASDSDLSGQVVWSKRADASTTIYPAGFTDGLEAIGSRYVAPISGQRILSVGDGQLTLSGGSLANAEQVNFNLADKNLVTGGAALKLTFSTKQGTFKGTATPASGPVSFQGVVLQKANLGAGYFLNANQSGRVLIRPME